jgi:predicted lipid-binding transport protein (Tim44 family)
VTGIIIFAMVALFLGLRLYSVLGKRTGHEQAFRQPDEVTTPPLVPPTGNDDSRQPPADEPPEAEIVEPSAEAGLRTVSSAMRGFDTIDFLEGAQSAYRMVLEAYWKGDLSPVNGILAEDVREAFEEAIAARNEADEILDNKLITIERAVISRAEMDGRIARITVRFDADIAAVTRDGEGRVIAGSLTDAVPTHDCWTFARDAKDADPNWMLIDTDEAA